MELWGLNNEANVKKEPCFPGSISSQLSILMFLVYFSWSLNCIWITRIHTFSIVLCICLMLPNFPDCLWYVVYTSVSQSDYSLTHLLTQGMLLFFSVVSTLQLSFRQRHSKERDFTKDTKMNHSESSHMWDCSIGCKMNFINLSFHNK